MNMPETWQLVRLSSVCAINPPLTLEERPTPDTSVSFIPMAAVDEIEGRITRRETRTFQEVNKGFTPFRENDVLINEWLAEIAAENTRMPHSIIRRVVLEHVNATDSPDFDGWLQHAQDTLLW